MPPPFVQSPTDTTSVTPWRLPTGSLYHWSLTGFMIVILPLVLALILGLLSMRSYTEQSQQALFQTVRATQAGQMLLERLISMERSIRQYQVLKDSELYSVFEQHHAAFVEVAERLYFDDVANNVRLPLIQLLQQELTLFRAIQQEVDQAKPELSLEDYIPLTLQARTILQVGGKQVAIEADTLDQEADRVRQKMLLWALLALPLALFLGLLFAYLLTRPIKRIERVISDLGAGHFHQPIVIHGPSNLVKLGQQLDWMRRRLMEVEEEKQRFIRSISHELKTPLATLREGADLLEDEVVGKLNHQQREIVQLMKIGTLQQNSLVENLLEYQRATNRQPLDESSHFDLAQLIRKMTTEYRLLIKTKQLVIVDQLETVQIQGDREAIRMMIGNLFNNAIKFSPEGGVIQLTLTSREGIATLLIEDQGEGIREEDRSLIYKEFYQGKSAGSWSVKGSGLGLALVQDTVQRHQGRINLIQSTANFIGARFKLELPLTQAIAVETVQCDI